MVHSQRKYSLLPIVFLSLIFLMPKNVLATTGLSNLAGLQGLLYIGLGLFVTIWLVIFLALYFVGRRRRKATGSPYFLVDTGIPLGLRLIALTQFVLAFLFSILEPLREAFQGALIPKSYLIQEWFGTLILLQFFFTGVALLSANGYISRSAKWGLKWGSAFGVYCVLRSLFVIFSFHRGALLHHLSHGWYLWFEILVFGFGALLLTMLNTRYLWYFGIEKPSILFTKILRLFKSRYVFSVVPVFFWMFYVLMVSVFTTMKLTGLFDWAIFLGGILVLFLVPQVIVEIYLRIAKKNSS
jgi:hypothetical protein